MLTSTAATILNLMGQGFTLRYMHPTFGGAVPATANMFPYNDRMRHMARVAQGDGRGVAVSVATMAYRVHDKF